MDFIQEEAKLAVMKYALRLLALALLISTIVCAAALSFKIQEEIKGAAEYARVCVTAMGGDAAGSRMGAEAGGPEKGNGKNMHKSPDEAALRQVNPEYAAWLYIPETAINYPVVYPKDNKTYLKKTFEGNRNACGTLFFDSASVPFISLNTVIHGHNMRSGAMFGGLKKYLSEEYSEKHTALCLYHQGRWKQYKLISVYLTSNTDTEPYQYMFPSTEDFKDFADKCCKRSTGRPGLGGFSESPSSLITLSACYGSRQKLILHFADLGEERE